MKDSITEPKSDKLWQKTQYANLVRYVPSGTYYARMRVKGKLIVKSLKTTVLSVAQLRLADTGKEERAKAERLTNTEDQKMTFGGALAVYRSLGYRPLRPRKRKDQLLLKERSKDYYEQRIKALFKTWPELENLPLNKILPEDLRRWANQFQSDYSGSAYNHTITVLRNVFQIGVSKGVIYDNPADYLIRATENRKAPALPTLEQFEAFVKEIETSGSGWSKHCANLVRFLAYGGFRKEEAANITWADCNFSAGVIRVVATKGQMGKEKTRTVPMIKEMRLMLEKLRSERSNEAETVPVMVVNECQKAMTRAAIKVGMPRLTHHDLRHLFATRVMGSGVDPKTAALWLGHADGGKLLLDTYVNPNDEHSRRMAEKVSFSKEAA